MARKSSDTLTTVELEFMEVLWADGEQNSDAVQRSLARKGRDLTDGSVRKMLQILLEKGQLTRRREGRSFLYTAKSQARHAKGRMVRDLVQRVFRGSAPRLVASLFETQKVSDRDLAEIKRLIAEHEKGSKR